ncbi:MAG: hypothetical protein F6K00_31305 [Leptolyngbya sp. SIOISBB]|nr:hypothetical protein [Leptolyngbya sp. SIOISBB]
MRIPWQLSGLTGLVGLLMSSAMSNPVLAQVPLTRADVEALQNNVEYLPERGIARAAALSDWLTLGDAIRTATASRADLRFNDGSLARIGEQATFWFVPNTRNFRLSNGTALLLVPPGRGASTIETPSAITGIQGTAVVIRHIPESPVFVDPEASPSITPSPGRTIVMALTNNPAGPVVVELPNGGQVSLVAGQMAIAADSQLEVFEFDLRLFYETSPLVADLHLDDPSFAEGSSPTAPVRQETLDALSQQANFVGLSWLNPDILDQQVSVATDLDWQVSASSYRSGLATNRLEAASSHLTDVGMGQVSVDFAEREPVVAQPTLDASTFDLDAGISGQNGLIPATVDSISDINAIALPPGVLEPVASPPVAPATPSLPAMPAVPATPVEPVDPVIPAVVAEPVEPVDPVIPAVVADPVADDDLENPENQDD